MEPVNSFEGNEANHCCADKGTGSLGKPQLRHGNIAQQHRDNATYGHYRQNPFGHVEDDGKARGRNGRRDSLGQVLGVGSELDTGKVCNPAEADGNNDTEGHAAYN